jgi:DNA repair photolyase
MIKIYQPKGRAREYSPFAINHFSGCDNGCIYCYVPRIMSMNEKYNHSDVFAKDIVDFEKEAARFARSKNSGSQIMLSFTCDPYCNIENGQTRKIIEILKRHNLHFNILTKNPHKALRDLDIIENYPNVKVGTTLTCLYDKQSLQYEPAAEPFSSRFEALKQFSEKGIQTWVSFEPVLFPEQTLEMIKLVSDFICDIKIGKLNNFDFVDNRNVDWKKFLHDAVKVADKHGIPFYIKKDLLVYDPTVIYNSMYIRTNEDSFNI